MNLQIDIIGCRRGFDFDAALTAKSGEVTALFGPSGCGKSSLLRAVAGLDRIRSGNISCGDQIWSGGDRHLLPHERHAALVYQRPVLFPHLSVRGNLELTWRFRRSGEAVQLAELINQFELTQLLNQRPDTLSGGEAQRVALARALASNPRALLLDEPLSGLDRSRRREILPYLTQLKQRIGIPLIYVTHSLDEVASLADQLVLMQRGRTVAQGPLDRMLQHPDLMQDMHGDEFSLLEISECQARPDQGLLLVETQAGQFRLPLSESRPDKELRLQVRARDVSLCLHKPGSTSILNVLPARVETLQTDAASGQVLVRLQANRGVLLSRISAWSCRELEIQPGMQLFAQIKAASLTRL